MAIKVVSPPSVEPVTLAQAKVHLRVTDSTEDDYILGLISAARALAEHRTGRSLASQTLLLQLDEWPDEIELERGPVQSVSWVKYMDADNVLQTVSPADYYLDDGSDDDVSWLLPGSGYSWPPVGDVANALRIQYIAGYQTCPATVQQWIKVVIGEMYEHRERSAEKVANAHPWVDQLLVPISINLGV